jgi:hypothetical protein
MTRTAISALLLALLTTTLLAHPAAAATRTLRDQFDDSLPATHDLREVTYRNGTRVLEVTVYVTDLRDVSTMVRTEFGTRPMRADGQTFEVQSKRLRGERPRALLFVRTDGRGRDRLRCDGARTRFDLRADRIVTVVPQFCLGEGTGRQQLTTKVGMPQRSFDESPLVRVGQG